MKNNDTIRIKINRNYSRMDALVATGFTLDEEEVDMAVVSTMPLPELDEVEAVAFYLESSECPHGGVNANEEDLEASFKKRNLRPIGPIALAAAYEQGVFTPCEGGTHWKDETGGWCFIFFKTWRGSRRLYVGTDEDGGYWHDHIWFLGIPI